ncbi:DUF202 domain-containing protein [Mycobacterium nebraskense]|uniref:DUF202 domain-containing protein n=1 Tax=Mycobacterium nebraskense TaxID=244292 RepID=A0A1X1ZNV3_9MYCO|nr:DUF202 domain-containing protein [Mycobacterium nebraskense]KKC02618.1 membrane protein [Mycobacterium nebraskense]MBI2693947.1 DUF202 domain-containing protein [Mycobacterium nebraskense]MCV7118563.1 DUF202 domain-containing protein [Mycobacterium nebraskense]ORW25056.1 hypothetical protein AWC17_02810 [Mycobacterium nebraskense]
MSDSPADRGSQADRTTLAWTRTSFAFLANGALLMIRNLHGSVSPTGLIPAALAGAVALGTFLIALQRQRTLRQRPLPERITPHRQVHFIGTAVLALIVVTTLAQFI